MKFKFTFKKEKLDIDVKVCYSIFSRASGLMFRKKSKPLLFVFRRKNRQAIHSFFCVPFYAIWFDEDKIVYFKLVKPWGFCILPKKKFDKLLEIPINDENFWKFHKN